MREVRPGLLLEVRAQMEEAAGAMDATLRQGAGPDRPAGGQRLRSGGRTVSHGRVRESDPGNEKLRPQFRIPNCRISNLTNRQSKIRNRQS